MDFEKERDCQFCDCCSEGHADEAPYGVEDLGDRLEFTCIRCGSTSTVKIGELER